MLNEESSEPSQQERVTDSYVTQYKYDDAIKRVLILDVIKGGVQLIMPGADALRDFQRTVEVHNHGVDSIKPAQAQAYAGSLRRTAQRMTLLLNTVSQPFIHWAANQLTELGVVIASAHAAGPIIIQWVIGPINANANVLEARDKSIVVY